VKWKVLVAAVVAGATAAAAYAHTVGNQPIVYSDSATCVRGAAWIQHSSSAVIDSAASVNAIGKWPNLGCSGEKLFDPYHMYVRRQLYSWNGSSWVLCNDSGTVYNTSRTWWVAHQRQFGSAICGARYYGTQQTGHVYEYGVWKGGSVWSGYHWLPS
jgi:hypothetical protein